MGERKANIVKQKAENSNDIPQYSFTPFMRFSLLSFAFLSANQSTIAPRAAERIANSMLCPIVEPLSSSIMYETTEMTVGNPTSIVKALAMDTIIRNRVLV